jgi:hypothetical protein
MEHSRFDPRFRIRRPSRKKRAVASLPACISEAAHPLEEIQPVTPATAKQRARPHRPWRASVQGSNSFYRTPRKKLAGEHFDFIELGFVTGPF